MLCGGCKTELNLPSRSPNAFDIAIEIRCEKCGDTTWMCNRCTYTLHPKSNICIQRRGVTVDTMIRRHSTWCQPSKRVKLNVPDSNDDYNHVGNDIEFDLDHDDFHADNNTRFDSDKDATNDEPVEFDLDHDDLHADNNTRFDSDKDATDDEPDAGDEDSQNSSEGWKIPSDDNLLDVDFIEEVQDDEMNQLPSESNALEDLVKEFTGADLMPRPIETNNPIPLNVAAYSFLDLRAEDEKRMRKNSVINCISQNQLYVAQKAYGKKQFGKDLGGFQGLVFRACVKDREHLSGTVSCLEAETSLLYTMLLLNLGKTDRERLLMYDNKKYQLTGYSNTSTRLQFPTTTPEMRSFVLDGRYSILKNFPSPKVFEIENHACVSLKEVFLLAAAHRGSFQFAWDGWTETANEDGLNGTDATKRLVREICEKLQSNGMSKEDMAKVNIGTLFFWSDSFLVSFVKQKDNSVWIMTVTISAPLDKINTGKYTFVLAMGRSNNDHTKVIEHYHREARELMGGFEAYFACRNEIKKTALGLLFHSGDRPERQVILGNRKEGHCGKCTLYAVCINAETFPACKHCYKVIIKMILDGSSPMSKRKCTKCLCWTIDPEDNPELYCRAGPEYPKAHLECNDVIEPKGREVGLSHLGPVKLTAQFMRLACYYAYKARHCGIWTLPNVREYLRTCNINQHWIDKIVERVEHDRKHKIESSVYEVMPKIWLGETDYEDPFNHCNFPDLPLHAFAHGMIPDIMDAIHQILAHMRKFTDYVNEANRTIQDIADMRLDWCKIKSLPKAAWVGENTMAYMRVMSYLYGRYFERFNFPQEKERTIKNVMRLIHAIQATMSLLMSMEKPKPGQVKLFLMMVLSAAHYLHRGYGSLDKKVEGLGEEAAATKRKDYIDNICLGDIMVLVDKLGLEDGTNNEAQSRSQLRRVDKKKLAQILKTMGEKVADNTQKLTLQQKLFCKILGRPPKFHTQRSQANTETWMWDKGGWISQVTNLDKQIQYLGVIQLIW